MVFDNPAHAVFRSSARYGTDLLVEVKEQDNHLELKLRGP